MEKIRDNDPAKKLRKKVNAKNLKKKVTDKPKTNKVNKYNIKGNQVDTNKLLDLLGGGEFEKFTKLSRLKNGGFSYTAKLKPGTYDTRDDSHTSGTISDEAIARMLTKKKTKPFDESDLDETVFKMDKWMPAETDVQDEYYDILENGDVGELEGFLEMHSDEEMLNRYLPKGAKLEDLATHIWDKYSSWGKKHKFSDEQPTGPENI
jgi:hypothetical protein